MTFLVNHPPPLSGNNVSEKDIGWMQRALQLADRAQQNNEVPIGALLVVDDELISEAHNSPIAMNDPTAHAEILALRKGGEKLGNYRLLNATLYVTLEPCLMCAGAMVHSRIKRLVFGAADLKAGGVISQANVLDLPFLNHRVTYEGGVLAESCAHQLIQFFKNKRQMKEEKYK